MTLDPVQLMKLLTPRLKPFVTLSLTAALCLACGGDGSSGGGPGPGSQSPYTLHVTLTGFGCGSVSSSAGALACEPGRCSQDVQGEVTLTATPDAGSTFLGWEGGCSGTTPTCTPTGARPDVVARFGFPGFSSRVLTGSSIQNTYLRGVARLPDGGTAVLVSNNEDPVDFGGQSATGVVLARYSSTGQLQWVKSWPDLADGETSSHQQLAVSSSGDLVVTGGFTGTINLGGSDLTSAGDRDIYVASYSTTGTPLWSRRFGGPGKDEGTSVAVDSSGAVALVGTYQQSVSFDSHTVTTGTVSTHFIARLSSSGTATWAVPFSGDDFVNKYIPGIACDGSGNVYVAGNSITYGESYLYLQKYAAANGSLLWSKTPAGDLYTLPTLRSIAVDTEGNAVVTGDFANTLDLGAGPMTTLHGNQEIFLARYSSGGSLLWARHFSSEQTSDSGWAVALDGQDNIYLTGQLGTFSMVDFGGGPPPLHDPAAFVTKLSPGGDYRWSQVFFGLDGYATASGLSVSINASGDVALGGTFAISADLGDATRTESAGGSAFVMNVPAGR